MSNVVLLKYTCRSDTDRSNARDKARVELKMLIVVAKDAMTAAVKLTAETGIVVLVNEALNKRGIS